jgi:MerR family transcriptional regulator, redox-sensitive transcriptional activator SoxR
LREQSLGIFSWCIYHHANTVSVKAHFKSRGNLMQSFTIGAIAQKAELATSAIRYYEKVGLLPHPARDKGRRYYDESVLPKLSVIKLAQEAGYTISEIHTLLNHFPADMQPSDKWQALGSSKLAEIDRRISHLQNMRALVERTLQCRCEAIEDCSQGCN